MKKKFIDIFCGAGGLTLGFERAGYKCIGAIDNSPACIETHKINFPRSYNLMNNIKDITPKKFAKLINNSKIDIIIGGPPCPTFSTIGHAKINSINKKKNNNFTIFDDERNFLFKNFFNYIEYFKPKFFIMENVPNFKSKYNGEIFNQTLDKIRKLKYKILNIDNLIFNSADYGVPQLRKRLFIIGCNDPNASFEMPKPSHYSEDKIINNKFKKKYITVSQAINDLPKITDNWRISECEYSRHKNLNDFQILMRSNNGKTVKNNICRLTNIRAKKLFSHLKQGQKYMDLPKKIRKILPFREDIFFDRLKRLREDKPSWTVIAHIGMDGYMYIHPNDNRTLSVREAARLQSFPDNYYFHGNQTETYHQVGNAVPVLLAEKIARSLKFND